MELLRADRVVKWQSQTFRLGPVDLALRDGEVLGIAGERGSGKTTLLRLIWGFLRPDEGTMSVFRLKPHLEQLSIRRHAGYLPESPHFDAEMTVWQHLKWTSRFYEGWDTIAADRLLERFGIKPEMQIRDLANGARIKLALISAAGHKPVLMLLDNPMAGLDPEERTDLSGFLKSLTREYGTGFVVSSRCSSDLEHCADSILTLNAGRISGERRVSRCPLQ